VEKMKKKISAIDLLYWVYGVQKAELVYDKVGLFDAEKIADGQMVYSRSADGCIVVERNGLLGGSVSGGGMFGSSALHEDAEAVHEFVLAMGKVGRSLVIENAKVGSHPDYMKGAKPRLVPVCNDNGEVVVYHDEEKSRKAKRKVGQYCLLTVDKPAVLIEAQRYAYKIWWNAVNRLACELCHKLKDYEIIGVGLDEMPWK
jgi:hypothetical protein